MSRVGKNPVIIPKGVKVTRANDRLTVKGPKGELSFKVSRDITVTLGDADVTVTRSSDVKQHRSLHGATRANIQNLVTGVTDGFKRNLEIIGVGYRAELRGRNLMLALGYSHQIAFFPPEGITIEVPTPTTISVSGIDKQLVGQVAAKIRGLRSPEPYKGKGVRYEGEHVRRKAGKTAKS